MDYKVLYTNSATSDLDNLGESIAKRVIGKLDFFLKSGDPLSYAKKLKGMKIDTYRFRIGDYRVLFRLDRGTIVVLVVLRITTPSPLSTNPGTLSALA